MVHKGNGVQIIYGPRVTVIKSNLEDYLETAPDEIVTNNTSAEDNTADKSLDTAGNGETAESTESTSVVKTVVISSPVTGLAADLSTAPDEAF